MRRQELFYLLTLGFVFLVSGCVVRTYPLTKDRVDQDLTLGNRGYIKGEAPAVTEKERKGTRTTQVVEVELSSPIKFEKAPKNKPVESAPLAKTEDQELWGNRGFLTQGQVSGAQASVQKEKVEKYTVQKQDTLQKISKKFYGTTKRWNKIYKANQDVLKGPNKIYPGQVLNIPLESAAKLMEPKENLK